MLSKEENELLTRVDAGTPMGRLFRRYPCVEVGGVLLFFGTGFRRPVWRLHSH